MEEEIEVKQWFRDVGRMPSAQRSANMIQKKFDKRDRGMLGCSSFEFIISSDLRCLRKYKRRQN